MGCELVAKTGWLRKQQTLLVETDFDPDIAEPTVETNKLICPLLEFNGLMADNCTGEILEARFITSHLTVDPGAIIERDMTLYLFKSINDGELFSNEIPDITTYYNDLLGIITFNASDFVELNTVDAISVNVCKGVISETNKGNINLFTSDVGVIYGYLFNNGLSTDFANNTMTIQLTIRRD